MMPREIAIVWFRRDLRLTDNPALEYAVANGYEIVPVYIHEPDSNFAWNPGSASKWWLHESLVALRESLAAVGGDLVFRCGHARDELGDIVEKSGATLATRNRLYDPDTLERDRGIKSAMQQVATVKSFPGYLLREPWLNQKDDGSPYRVFTPFSKQYFAAADPERSCPESPDLTGLFCRMPLRSDCIEQAGLLPNRSWHNKFSKYWKPGEQGAASALDDFLSSGLDRYGEARDFPGEKGVSSLSAHLHYGEVSVDQVWQAVNIQRNVFASDNDDTAASSAQGYLRQLVWRDFAHHILFHYPDTPDKPFNKRFESFEWETNDEFLTAWQSGETGIPLVDAGMRELWETGWVHNRVRMIVASVLTKNGLVHWRDGAEWFWDTLVDANLANNAMGWQWVAGCGVDAAPYFRVFSPVRQGERFDPLGEYVKKWIPALSALPAKYIHAPEKAGNDILEAAGIQLGKTYPQPILDLSTTRIQALERYKKLRSA